VQGQQRVLHANNIGFRAGPANLVGIISDARLEIQWDHQSSAGGNEPSSSQMDPAKLTVLRLARDASCGISVELLLDQTSDMTLSRMATFHSESLSARKTTERSQLAARRAIESVDGLAEITFEWTMRIEPVPPGRNRRLTNTDGRLYGQTVCR
jgi:hypothetical protein